MLKDILGSKNIQICSVFITQILPKENLILDIVH